MKSRGFIEDVRLSNVRLFVGTIIIAIALVAQFYRKKFPENRNFLIGCIILYPFSMTFVLLSSSFFLLFVFFDPQFFFNFLCRSLFGLSRDLSHVACVRLLKTFQATKICKRGLSAQAEGTTEGLCGQGDGANEKNETFDSSISLLFHVNFLLTTNYNAGLSYCFIEILENLFPFP